MIKQGGSKTGREHKHAELGVTFKKLLDKSLIHYTCPLSFKGIHPLHGTFQCPKPMLHQ